MGNQLFIALDPSSIFPLTTPTTPQPQSFRPVYRQAVERHRAFTNASSLLATALLLESIGDTNRTQLEASFHPLPLYAITPTQIVATMIILYGVATGTDLQRLREPLLEPLKALAELEPFMAKFKLNKLKLTTLRPSSLLYRASL
jgi:hypothetical protein